MLLNALAQYNPIVFTIKSSVNIAHPMPEIAYFYIILTIIIVPHSLYDTYPPTIEIHIGR
jgi:hypothetical protein